MDSYIFEIGNILFAHKHVIIKNQLANSAYPDEVAHYTQLAFFINLQRAVIGPSG